MTRVLVLILAVVLGAALPATAQGGGVVVNGRELTVQQAQAIQSLYGYGPPPGHYWYDSRSGAWGIEGRATAGFIMPGHNLGWLRADASHGNTGVFINGRGLNMAEALFLQQTFGAVCRGRWWLDGRTGYWGAEGNPIPLGNIMAAMRMQRGGGGNGGDNFWSTSTGTGNWSGDCGYVSVGGSTVMTVLPPTETYPQSPLQLPVPVEVDQKLSPPLPPPPRCVRIAAMMLPSGIGFPSAPQ